MQSFDLICLARGRTGSIQLQVILAVRYRAGAPNGTGRLALVHVQVQECGIMYS